MKKYFKGYYYKHQKGRNVLSIIAGESSEEKFIQILTKENSYHIPSQNKSVFSIQGIKINIEYKDISLKGKVNYKNLILPKYDIMGPFKFFPMECKHKIVSMNHRIEGGFFLNGKYIDFTNGTGYIEGDFGTSFPKSYLWIQCADFHKNYSIMASVANIPFGIFNFNGCICNINYHGKEYRLATYLGAKIVCMKKNKLTLKQRKYKLDIEISDFKGQKLKAPNLGKMDNIIYEDIATLANFKFYINDNQLFNISNKYTSFEYMI